MPAEVNGPEKTYPICWHCGVEIICVTPDTKPYAILVRDPVGHEHLGGEFCLECMIEFTQLGVLLYPLPPDVNERRLAALKERGVRE